MGIQESEIAANLPHTEMGQEVHMQKTTNPNDPEELEKIIEQGNLQASVKYSSVSRSPEHDKKSLQESEPSPNKSPKKTMVKPLDICENQTENDSCIKEKQNGKEERKTNERRISPRNKLMPKILFPREKREEGCLQYSNGKEGEEQTYEPGSFQTPKKDAVGRLPDVQTPEEDYEGSMLDMQEVFSSLLEENSSEKKQY